MGYCEFKIPFYLEGVYVKTAEMVKGEEIHEEAEKLERETTITVPLTRTKLEDKKADLDFVREDIWTRFTREYDFPNGKAQLTLYGRADKVMRHEGTLIISDDKNTSNPTRHDARTEPYDNQLLQVMAYLHSRYYLGSSFGGWAEIPHVQKAYQVNIVDSRTKLVYKKYEEFVTKDDIDMLLDYASRFTQKCLELDVLAHHNSRPKCKACGYFENCDMALK